MTMKNIFTILILFVSQVILAQENCNFFEHTSITIEKTNINTAESDFGPAFVDDQLWYSSFTDEELRKLAAGKRKNVFYNVFTSPVDIEGNLLAGKEIQLEKISKGFHTGPVSYCSATKELFVTISNFKEPDVRNTVYQKSKIRLKILVLKKENTDWNVVGEMPFNDPTHSVGHPAISQTGDTLFFASNMHQDNIGGTDIYMSVRNGNTWGDPVNLGEEINTEKNEMFPFFYKGNMLVFSSNGHNKLDSDLNLYYSCAGTTGFSIPVALDEFNTVSDDFGLIIHEGEKVGYFNSRRSGGLGDDDIYKVNFEKGEFKLELLVKEKITGIAIPSANVVFNDDEILSTNSEGMVYRGLDYDTDYKATANVVGFISESVSFSTINQPYGVIKVVIEVLPVIVDIPYTLNNIFYDFDKWDILPESEFELDNIVKLMTDNPGWKVELGSHTDSRGTDSYNELLSQKRSDSAVGYVISKGIDKSRIIAKGYGESQLVNHCANGVKCSPEDHRKNRRTEFKILELK